MVTSTPHRRTLSESYEHKLTPVGELPAVRRRDMAHINVSFDAWIAHAHVIASSELSHSCQGCRGRLPARLKLSSCVTLREYCIRCARPFLKNGAPTRPVGGQSGVVSVVAIEMRGAVWVVWSAHRAAQPAQAPGGSGVFLAGLGCSVHLKGQTPYASSGCAHHRRQRRQVAGA